MGCRPASTPTDPNLKLSKEFGDLLPDQSQYQILVGRPIYVTNTQPDINFALSVMSQFMHAPCTFHLNVVHHILQYLKTYSGLDFFLYSRRAIRGVLFHSSDYARFKGDRRSTSHFCTFYDCHHSLS